MAVAEAHSLPWRGWSETSLGRTWVIWDIRTEFILGFSTVVLTHMPEAWAAEGIDTLGLLAPKQAHFTRRQTRHNSSIVGGLALPPNILTFL